MKRMMLGAVALAVLTACGPKPEQAATAAAGTTVAEAAPVAKLQYAPTKQGDVVDTYFETKVADPYRWLEDDRSAETAEWVKAQNGKVELIEIDVDENQELAKSKKIEAIPYLEMYKNGVKTWSSVGLIGKEELDKSLRN